jgi:uncharacterized protein YoaH (UPF0181 family)
MMSQNQYERVQSYICKGMEDGAEGLVGGEAIHQVLKRVTS